MEYPSFCSLFFFFSSSLWLGGASCEGGVLRMGWGGRSHSSWSCLGPGAPLRGPLLRVTAPRCPFMLLLLRNLASRPIDSHFISGERCQRDGKYACSRDTTSLSGKFRSTRTREDEDNCPLTGGAGA